MTTDVTNITNSLKIAVIKNQTVIDLILVHPSNFDELKNSLISKYEADELVVTDENCHDCFRSGPGSFYDGQRLYPPKTYPSWIWSDSENNWVSPVEKPVLTEDTPYGVSWDWDEYAQVWTYKIHTP